MFDIFKNLLQLKTSTVAGAFVSHFGQSAHKNYNELKNRVDGYEQNVVVYRCVSIIANEVAKVPFVLYDAKGNLIKDHELLTLLLNPNEMQSKSEYITDVISNKLISGNAYLEAAYPTNGEMSLKPPVYLYSLNPSFMEVIPGLNGIPSGYKYTQNGKGIMLPVGVDGTSNIMHLKTFNPTNHWYGFSPIQAAAMNIDQLNLSNQWNNNTLKNGGNVSGVVELSDKKTYTEKNMKEIREGLQKFKGSQSTSIMSLPEGVIYKPMGLTPQDMNFLDGIKLASQMIAFAFGVPYDLVNTDQAKYDNLDIAKELLWDQAIKPNLEHLISELNTWLVPRYGDYRLGYDQDAVEAIATKRDRKRKSLEGCTFMSANEKRLAMGMDNVQGGDDILVEMNKIPLDQVGYEDDTLPDDEKAYTKSLIKQGYDEKQSKILTGLVYDNNE